MTRPSSAPPPATPPPRPLRTTTSWPVCAPASFGPDPRTQRIAVAFTTRQAVRHEGRGGGYRNEVLSLRLGRGRRLLRGGAR